MELELTKTTPPLREEFVRELIEPDYPSRPLGEEEALSDYLYKPMIKSQEASAMVAFVDATEPHIYKEDIDDQSNHLKIYRMLALVADMPPGVPQDERLKVWRHLFDSDWVHTYAHPGDLQDAIRRSHNKQPATTKGIFEALRLALDEKIELFKSEVGFTDKIPEPFLGGFEINELYIHRLIDGLLQVQIDYPEFTALYNSMIVLTMTSREAAYILN